MKPGITLIEVALSILLASFLASVLFISFSQLQLASRITDSFIEVDMRSAVVIHQMGQDIAGAFVPQIALIQTTTGKSPATPPSGAQKGVTPLAMDTVFMVKHKDKHLDMFTCITDNPIAVYDTVKPSLARVVYRLVPDKEREGTFRLLRQESEELNVKKFEASGSGTIRSYELAHNIKSCSCVCTLLDYTQEDAGQDTKKPATKKITARTVTDWMYDPKKAKEAKMPPLPYALTITCVFWDDQHRREWPVTFSVVIPSFEPYTDKKKERKKKPSEQPASQTDASKQTLTQPSGDQGASKPDSSGSIKPVLSKNVADLLARQNRK